MSISSEITSIGENLKKDYQSIANLGADLTNVDKNIENIAELLDGVYDRLPKTEYQEGTEVNLGVTSKGKLDYDNGVVGIGQSSQDSTNGYQLFDITKKTSSTGTLINNGFKLVKSNNRVIRFMLNAIYPAGTYTLSMKQVSHISSLTNYFYLNIQKKNGLDYDGIKNGIRINNSTDIEIQIPGEFDTLYFYIDNGETDNAEVTVDDVMFESGTTAHDWEEYTGGQASPNPSYEQEIKYVAGRNKFKGTLYNGIINNSGDYVSNSTRITNSNNGLNSQVYLEKGTYTLSIKDLYYCSVLTKNASGTIVDNYAGTWNTLPFTFNVTSGAYVYISARKSSNTDISPSDYNIMLEEGTQATPYLPYNTIEEVVSDNILDLSTLYLHPNNNLRVINNDNELEIKPNTTITIKANAGYNYGYFELDANKQTLVDSGWKYGVTTFTSNSNAKYLRLNLRKSDNSVISNLEEFIEGIGLEIQYSSSYITPTSYQLSLGDYKFYGIGTYRDYIWTDRETKKWYKHSEIGEKIFTGASSENWLYWQGLILIDDTTIRSLGTSNTNFYLNYFRNVLSIAYIGSNTGQRLHINLSNSGLSEITTTTAWKTWLSTHNLEFVYVCNETDTEITGTLAEQLEEWWNGQTLNGTTIITSNGNLPMIIKVRGLKGE